MTAKDYQIIAKAIQSFTNQNPQSQKIMRQFTTFIADRLREENPKFDMTKFQDCAGL